MTEKRKRQIVTILNTSEILFFLIAVAIIFVVTTGIFTKSQWQQDNTHNSKSFTQDTLDSLSEKNMFQPTAIGEELPNILPNVSETDTSQSNTENQLFSENDIMIQANELLIFDEL